jgi:hypothetical protein
MLGVFQGAVIFFIINYSENASNSTIIDRTLPNIKQTDTTRIKQGEGSEMVQQDISIYKRKHRAVFLLVNGLAFIRFSFCLKCVEMMCYVSYSFIFFHVVILRLYIDFFMRVAFFQDF